MVVGPRSLAAQANGKLRRPSATPQFSLGGRVVDFDAAVVGIRSQGRPQLERVQNRHLNRHRFRLARERSESRLQPALEVVEQWLATRPPLGEAFRRRSN